MHLAIDDFGTGYSSLSYLKRFPIDTLKIDQSFVRDIVPGDKMSQHRARSYRHQPKISNSQVVAEGVETLEQLTALRESACDQYQGYYFSRPVAATEAASLLRTPPYNQCLDYHI